MFLMNLVDPNPSACQESRSRHPAGAEQADGRPGGIVCPAARYRTELSSRNFLEMRWRRGFGGAGLAESRVRRKRAPEPLTPADVGVD